jgi:hypothetical protein
MRGGGHHAPGIADHQVTKLTVYPRARTKFYEPPCSVAAFVVNSEPRTGARPSVCVCGGANNTSPFRFCVERAAPPTHQAHRAPTHTSALFTFLLARDARAYTSFRSISFCAIFVCISSSSSSSSSSSYRLPWGRSYDFLSNSAGSSNPQVAACVHFFGFHANISTKFQAHAYASRPVKKKSWKGT